MLNAWETTTEAVLCPTPGNFSKADMSSGTFPSKFLTKIDDNCFMALDFWGPRPHGLMIL